MKIPINTLPYEMRRSVWTNPLHFIACGFGIGLIPFAPGTFATLAAIIPYLMLLKVTLFWRVIIVIAINIIGIWLCGKVNRDFNTDDHPAAVYDELAAFQIALLGLPFHWPLIVIGFVLFRVFDIWKPGLIGWIDKNIHGGVGVMLDDIVAAIVTWMLLYLIVIVFY